MKSANNYNHSDLANFLGNQNPFKGTLADKATIKCCCSGISDCTCFFFFFLNNICSWGLTCCKMKLQRRPVFSLLGAAADVKSAAPRGARLTEHFRGALFPDPVAPVWSSWTRSLKSFEVFPWIEKARNKVTWKAAPRTTKVQKKELFEVTAQLIKISWVFGPQSSSFTRLANNSFSTNLNWTAV